MPSRYRAQRRAGLECSHQTNQGMLPRQSEMNAAINVGFQRFRSYFLSYRKIRWSRSSNPWNKTPVWYFCLCPLPEIDMNQIFSKLKISMLSAVFAVSIPLASQASVDQQLVGTWSLMGLPASAAPLVWQIEATGRYKSIAGPKVVEQGNLVAADGTWSVKADSGRADAGSFTISDGVLQLNSKTGPITKWRKAG